MPLGDNMSIEETIRTIIREELERFFEERNAPDHKLNLRNESQFEEVVTKKSEALVEEFIEDTPVKQTVEVNNTADLMAQLKEMVSKEKGLGQKAKALLVEHFDYAKFSEVPDDQAQVVYNKVCEEL
jgi:uncharacterized protein (DUF1697 family)